MSHSWCITNYTQRRNTHVVGICWRCDCTPDQLRNVGADAAWRRNRRTTWDLLRMLKMNGIKPSPLFNAPWVTVEIFRMDWLHCVHQGGAATLLGCVFYITIRRKEDGANVAAKANAFWSRVQGQSLLYLALVTHALCSTHRYTCTHMTHRGFYDYHHMTH